MFRRKAKSTLYMRGLLYAESLREAGKTIDELEYEFETHHSMLALDRFDCGFRDFIHLLTLRELKNAT